MCGVGESLVIDARLEDLERLILLGKIKNIDEAKECYPTINDSDIQEVFDSLLKKDN